jgi:hypothetical protein
MATQTEHPTARALSFAQLPNRIDGWRVLEIGGSAAGEEYLTGIGASEFLALDEPSEKADLGDGDFDLAICSSDLETDLHPLAVFAWLRKALGPEGILVAGSTILPDPTLSHYARFDAGRWTPGRLALRWMVEVSGFDVLDWLGGREEDPLSERAYLQAMACDRPPALDLARQPLGR